MRQAFDDFKKVIMAFVAPASPFGGGLDCVGCCTPEDFGAQQSVPQRNGLVRQIEELYRRGDVGTGIHSFNACKFSKFSMKRRTVTRE